MAHERKYIKGQWTPGPEARQIARNSIKKTLKYLFRNEQPEQAGQSKNKQPEQAGQSKFPDMLSPRDTALLPKTYPAPNEQIIGTSPQPYDIAGSYKKFLAEKAPKVTIPYRRGHDPKHDPKKDISIIPQDTSDEIVEIKENKDQRVLDKVGDITSDIMDKELQKTNTTGEPPRPLSSVWEEALITIGPALAGILEPGLETGKIGLASQKHYLERKDLEQERLDELAGVGGSSSRRFSPIKYTDPVDGKVKLGSFDRSRNEYSVATDDMLAGYGPRFLKDAEGAWGAFNPNNPNAVIKNRMGRYTTAEHKVLYSVREQLKSSGVVGAQYQKQLDRYNKSADAKELLFAGKIIGETDGKANYLYNSIAGEAVKTVIAKMSGEVGTLTDLDIKRFGGDEALKNKAVKMRQRLITGVSLSPKDRENLLEIVEVFEKVTSEKIHELLKTNIKSYKSQFEGSGLKEQDFLNVLNPYGRSFSGHSVPPHKKHGIKGVTKTNKDEIDIAPSQSNSQKKLPAKNGGTVLMIPPGTSVDVELEIVDREDINHYLNKGYFIYKGAE